MGISQKTPTAVTFLGNFRRGKIWTSLRITLNLRMAWWAAVLHCLKKKKAQTIFSVIVVLLMIGSCRPCLIYVLLSCLVKYTSHTVITHLKIRNNNFFPVLGIWDEKLWRSVGLPAVTYQVSISRERNKICIWLLSFVSVPLVCATALKLSW